MDCSVFRKRLQDLMEDNLSYDLREAMLQHIKECKECKALYEEELEIDEMFKIGVSEDMPNFRSLRNDIMKSIDKNKYSTSSQKKLAAHFKTYKAPYASLAAVILFFAVVIPYVRHNNSILGVHRSSSAAPEMASKSVEDSIGSGNSDKQDTLNTAQKSMDSAVPSEQEGMSIKLTAEYVPVFEKKLLASNTEVSFNTPWENSLHSKYSASVEGKGPQAQEEGIGNIVLKDLSSGQKWSFSLANNEQKQFTPKAVKWIDDENLLVIVGYGMGQVQQGGDLYILNINSVRAVKADPANTAGLDNKSEITRIQKITLESSNVLSIETEVTVFDDNLLKVNHKDVRTITSPFGEIVNELK